MSPLTIVALGFLLGLRHATDPDHVVAVSAMVSRERSLKGAALLGVSWGAGHAAVVLAVGGAMVVGGVTLPPRLGLGLELCVAAMLVALGAANIRTLLRGRAGGAEAAHRREHAARRPGRASLVRSLVVGMVHGLAGSAGVALLVVASISSPSWALVYLALFGTGTVGGMVLITIALALPFVATKAAARFRGKLVWVTGVVSILAGFGVAYQVVITDGWLSMAPHWAPH